MNAMKKVPGPGLVRRLPKASLPWSARRSGTSALCGLATLVAAPFMHAASEFEDAVPVGLVKIFLGLAPGEAGGLYREIPEDFPLVSAPEGFRVLGVVKQQYSETLYLETGLGEDAAVEAMQATLGEDDWLRLPAQSRPSPSQTGFLGPQGDTPQSPEQFCHDQHGNLRMTYRESADENLVTLRQSPPLSPFVAPLGAPLQTCREQAEARLRTAARMDTLGNGLAEFMPRLELPREADFGGRPAGSTGGLSSSGRNETRARTDLAIDWEAERLYAYFEGQLSAQMWSEQDSWRNAATAGGVWARATEGTELRGVLTILTSGEDRYILEFRLVLLENG